MSHIEEVNPDLLQEQIERRRKRGAEDLVKVVNKGRHPVYSTFEVTPPLSEPTPFSYVR